MRPLLVLALLAGLAPAAPVPKALKKTDDTMALLGGWKTVRLSLNGRPSNDVNSSIVFDADGGAKMLFGRGGVSDWSWTIDSAQTPKRMKWTDKTSPTNVWECVYELSGDSFKLGFVTPGKPAPDAVEASDNLTLYELVRDTPAK